MTLGDVQSADVVIVGAGPVGLTLANLLGQYGVKTLLIERNAAIEHAPRAVTLDDESLRTFQNAGLADTIIKDVVLGYGVQYFDWRGKPFAAIQPTHEEYGYPKRNAFGQPLLVRALFEGTARFAHVDVRFGHEFVSFEQDERVVRCHVKTADGQTLAIESPWVVACDGGRSKVRELCGIVLDGDTYPQRWLIVDLAGRTTPLRHTRTYCDPRRPAIRLPGPDGALRYEFMLHARERDDDVLDEQVFRTWIAERVAEDAELRLVRKAVYGFHARVAMAWKQGRVLLAGDAAHLTPPFAGQGLNSGIRDAANLAWKLAAVTHGRAGVERIDSYEQERRPHATALIRMALRIGAFMQPKSIAGAVAAQAALRLACVIPACRDYILQLRFKPKPRFAQGWFEASPRHAHAELLPQPLVERPRGERVRLDTLLGNGFALLGWDTPAYRASARRLLPSWMPGCAVALVRRDHDFLGPEPDAPLVRVRDLTGELGAVLQRCAAPALLIRPDRYSYRLIAADELAQASSIWSTPEETIVSTPSPARRVAVVAIGAAIASSLLPETARAQASEEFPNRPVRIITAFPPGSGPDAALRVVAERLAKKWSQAVIVDNRPGGSGFIAINAIKQSAPDGHELIQLDSNHLTTHPHTFSRLPYDPQKDLEPVRPLFRNSFFVVVSVDSPFKSVDDIITAAKVQPGQVTYGSWFTGSPGHLGALRLQKMKGIEMLHVPYREMTQLYSSVATQEVHWALGSAASAGALERAGKVRFIAVAAPARSKAYPNVPSVDEAPGTKGFEAMAWTGLFAPKGTPKGVREKISADVLEALKSADIVERYRAFDYELFDADPDAFAQAIARDTKNWAEIIKAANLKLD